MRFPLLVVLLLCLVGCAGPTVGTVTLPAPLPATLNSVTPSTTGSPNSVASLWPYEFVSVQGVGQVYRYNISTGAQVLLGAPYATPCSDPSGMVIANISGANVMAVVCYDTGSLLTLTVNADGSLSPLGSASGLGSPFPGIALDGTNVLIPLYGVSGAVNGGVAKVSIASPTAPILAGKASLASPFSGGFANPGSLAVGSGKIFVSAGSESGPQSLSSTIQVVDEATMALVGAPLVVAHSPQYIAVQGSTLYATFYDAAQLESIDVSNPASLMVLQVMSFATASDTCSAIPILMTGTTAVVGCYGQNEIKTVDVSSPAAMQVMHTLTSVASPQNFGLTDGYLLVAGGVDGGQIYQVGMGLVQ